MTKSNGCGIISLPDLQPGFAGNLSTNQSPSEFNTESSDFTTYRSEIMILHDWGSFQFEVWDFKCSGMEIMRKLEQP